jgi:hypothetical protein
LAFASYWSLYFSLIASAMAPLAPPGPPFLPFFALLPEAATGSSSVVLTSAFASSNLALAFSFFF